MKASKSARAVLRFVLISHAVGAGVPLDDEDDVVDSVVLEACVVSVGAVVVSAFVVLPTPVVAVAPPPEPPAPPAPPPAPPPAAPSSSDEVDVAGL